MTFTVTISELALLLAAIAFFILVIYLIPAIIQLRNTARAVEDLSQKGKEAIEDIGSLAKKVNGQSEDVGEVVKKIKEVGLKAVYLADVVLTQLKGPIITITSIIAGVEFGLKHFRKKEKGGDKDVRE
ncbi:MAG: hypothetical protein A3G39_10795 [Deltaproteobacteria bacterium RIFCSPLOWO2_12_FULL_43_16]|nr:MAG: hypothetical protein A2Z89_10885 [Deltaproteobacteria bacterium GWA2_43_19]OGQ09116.1 MAG: hypothetical protein A3D30_10445 [Deltaproteobacteria bacterium RIFCSPHIGHO2_02_FULL_43_33]OGQ57670.1 MAG: hypothetical protein A3G39_10795 [Deltaproteobacteria bacterium RIFCSPLOWO2_12_FULL_43_16]HBR16869.1 hypothetical protein [Deltaproteobacteria bacterium]